MPYKSGPIPGVKTTNFPYGTIGIDYNDGVNVKGLGYDDYYLSTDCSLTAFPSALSFGTLTDGMLLDLGVYYFVKSDLSTCEMVNNRQLLISIQDVSVLNGTYTNAVIMWWIDTNISFKALNLHGKESDLGITLPTSSETGGHAVTGFDIFGYETGSIALGYIEASTGSLNYLSELKEISPITAFSGWVWMEGSCDFVYSVDENDLLYFLSFGPVWYYNITTGLWGEEGPGGWIYVSWPFLYELDTDTYWFAYPPASGLWVYHFSTGEWELWPQIIP